MTDIKLYGATWCHACKRVIQWLHDNGLAYDYVNVDEEEGREELKTLGYSSIPVTIINDTTIVGYNKTELEDALNG